MTNILCGLHVNAAADMVRAWSWKVDAKVAGTES